MLLFFHNWGLKTSPELFVGNAPLESGSAASEVFPDSKWQRCWVHKAANILNKLPKSILRDQGSMIPEKNGVWFNDQVESSGLSKELELCQTLCLF